MLQGLMTRSSRRDHLLEAMADHLVAVGLDGASLRPLAAAAGTSDRMLLYYFADKDDLIDGVLTTVAERLTRLVDGPEAERRPAEALVRELWAAARTPAVRPYMQLFLEVAARAGRGEEPYRRVGGQIADLFLQWTEQRILVAPGADPRAAAAQILATIDGFTLLDAVGRGGLADRAFAGDSAAGRPPSRPDGASQ